MTWAPASLAALSWVPSCEPSMAPTTMTLAPLVTMAEIWFCCSDTPPLANCTSPWKPAADRPSLNSCSASTQFSEVFCGRAMPMTALAGKPAAAEPPLDAGGVAPPSLLRPQPVRTRAATAVTPSTLVKVRMCSLSSHRVRAGRAWVLGLGRRPDRVLVGRAGGSAGLADALGDRGDLRGGGRRRRSVVVVVGGASEALRQQTEDRDAALRLVVDVEGDGDEENEALDHLGRVGADSLQLQAVVEHGHHKASDDGADDGAHTAGDGRAADEHGGD